MCVKPATCVDHLFSLACWQYCMSKFKHYPVSYMRKVPTTNYLKDTTYVPPTASAAVLVPLCRVNDVPSLLYTVRSQNLRVHRGEVSFPGGKTDEGETPVETALRESEEEIGLSLMHNVCIWGHGPAFPGRNNSVLVTPVIASISELQEAYLNVNNSEVAEVFTIPVKLLCDPKNQYWTQYRNGYLLPVFAAEKYKIWGLTAYITHAFLSCALSKDVYNNKAIEGKNIVTS